MHQRSAFWNVSASTCPHGGVHIHFGPTTIHLTADQLRALAHMTARMLVALGESSQATLAPRAADQPH